ncbi:hypothetical protein [Mangrovicoccus algicola]|uniref:DUF1585 domain-containing protein n=1 Tax=Mangrovicoccus algicola TaxID=2771008 RepID=A0A8J6Z4Z1_9RHOB|nr:hypothetical protein [Mangrovicoccus algicola]MBE3637764.1 hypothetical protein [Mangrovicoccus algicola]
MGFAVTALRLLLLMAALGSGAGLPAAARAASYCADLVEIREEGDAPVLSVRFSSLFDLFRREDSSEPSRISDSKYWFTTRFGQFDGLTCGRFGHEMQEYYPIGIVVKPLRQLDLPNYHRGTPVLVETEYGHRKVLPLEDMAPIAVNTTYLLPDSAAKAWMCNHEDSCRGNLVAPVADGIEMPCPSAECRYDISAFGGYASVGSQNDGARQPLEEYRRLMRDPMAPPVRFADDAAREEAMRTVCAPFQVTAWKGGGTRHQPRRVWLSLCSEMTPSDGGPAALSVFKIVDTAWAEARFGDGLWGSFHRRFGESSREFDKAQIDAARIADGLRDIIQLRLGSEKPCGQVIEETNSLTLGGGAGFDLGAVLPVEALTLSVDAARERNEKYRTTIPADVFLAYSTYFVHPIPLEDEQERLWVFDIISRVQCSEAGIPQTPASITLFYHSLTDGYEILDAGETLSRRYFSRNGNLSYQPADVVALMRTGRFWRVPDHIGYFTWRDALREVVSKDMPQIKQLLEYYPPQERPQMRDFFVHLLLAAAFDYDADFRPNG